MKKLVLTITAAMFAAPAMAQDVRLVENKDVPYESKWTPGEQTAQPPECRLSLGLFTIPCHDGFEYFEPEGDDDTPNLTIITDEPPVVEPPKRPKPPKRKKDKKRKKDRPCKTISRC